jgi:riboflavin kinase / FMN adenylyltransferase
MSEDRKAGTCIATIGSFDGVHRGHQALLAQARLRADEIGLPLTVVTFEPLPAQVIRPEQFTGRLITPEEKQQRLRQFTGADVLKIDFDDALRNLDPNTFLRRLHDQIQPMELWVGEEFALGRDRSGTIDRLKVLGPTHGFDVHAVPRLELEGDIVSSSRIRKAIIEGDVELAERLQGYRFATAGEVIRGAQIGRTIGYPTANVEPPDQIVPLADGIYASYAQIEGDPVVHQAMTYIGTRPALNTGGRLIETHLFDFNDDLYGKVLQTKMVARLRPDAAFDSLEALIEQLNADGVNARATLAAHPSQREIGFGGTRA